MINWAELEANRSQYGRAFKTAKPFRHVAFENFLNPETARRIEEGFETALAHKNHASAKSHKDVFKKTGTPNVKLMTAEQAGFFDEINSPRFIAFLGEITGIDPIFGDPELRGGGLHSSVRDAFLNVHTDFNFHPVEDTHRRLNLIFYVNSVWDEEWEGGLELWNRDVSACEAKFFPRFNRAVLFETSEISFHGHPVPLKCPEGVSRKSVAVYYYSDWPEGLERRAKTHYVLTPQQKQVLRALVTDAINKGARNFEEASQMIPNFQPSHIKRMFLDLDAARA